MLNYQLPEKKEENLNDFSTTRTTNIKNTDTLTCCQCNVNSHQISKDISLEMCIKFGPNRVPFSFTITAVKNYLIVKQK